MKSRVLMAGILSICLVVVLGGCASDPYENAGSCEITGASRESDGKVQVCIGIDGKLKWYTSGKYFEDFQLLGKITYGSNFDIAEPEIRSLGLIDYSFQFEELAVKSEDIASYADGDTRWDGIIEAIADVDLERQTQDYLLDERFRTSLEWRRENGSQQKAYEAQQSQIEHMNGPLVRANRNFDRKIAVLMADIVNRYGITNKKDSVIFALRILRNQDTAN